MCTMIAHQIEIRGSGKAGPDWLKLDTASVSYDHPFELPLEYTLNLDFTSQSDTPDKRVAVELDARSARDLVEAIQAVLLRAEEGGFLQSSEE
ncbi:MAG: DUF6295 family protein [Acidobacteriaceae bacterium]